MAWVYSDFLKTRLTSCIILGQVEEYKQKLDEVIIKMEDGTPMLPEMYTVPRDKVVRNRSFLKYLHSLIKDIIYSCLFHENNNQTAQWGLCP